MGVRHTRVGWLWTVRKEFLLLACLISTVALFPLSLAAQTPASDKTPDKKAQDNDNKKATDKGKKADKKADDQDDKPLPGKPIPEISPTARYDAQGEATFILQHIDRFYSPYEGRNSLRSRNETELSDTYQYVANPGYNQDRGPVSFLGFRAHVPF